ncbi:osmoprotectant ABC transporter substrate-binding lipoprotein OpuCC [Lentibacillus halophilus]|uniref:Osmoprotectant ABC transporter substrate-binding lipoprotein OpuCC n=1 Tax=Lentibacillus halophilus TaxID=295065 RepID=A0ABN0Z6F3_9BACI
MKKQLSIILSVLILMTLSLSACSSSGSGSGGSITIGTQTYTETKILAEMYKALIEDNTDVSVDIKTDLETSPVTLKAMQSGDIQMSTQYTGTALSAFFSIENPKDPEATLKQAKEDFSGDKFNFKWFDSVGYANTYAFAVRDSLAEKYDLETISDLKGKANNMTAAFDTSWLERDNDGYDAFKNTYDLEFGKTRPMEIGLVYDAVKEKDVDIALAYSTDARIEGFDLTILEDNKQFFPPYDASPVVTQKALDNNPGISDAIEPLLGKLDEAKMGKLNGKVDLDGKDPKDVALNYLKDQGMLK